MSTPNTTSLQNNHQQTSSPSQIPTPLRSMSRNNSNISVASSTNTTNTTNRGELNSTISTATTSNSIASSYKSHLSKTSLKAPTATPSLSQNQSSLTSADLKLQQHQSTSLLTACAGTSTPIRSFQRATISSVVKTRAFDNSPILQSLLAASSPINNANGSNKNSVSNSQTPSPHSTPVFSRSRSLRMSGGPSRYSRNSPSQFYRQSSRTPDVTQQNYHNNQYSFNSHSNSIDYSNSICGVDNVAPIKLAELTNETLELKESLEFSEIERQAFEDTTRELKTTLHNERSQWKRELDELKKQLEEATANRIKAESQSIQKDLEMNDLRLGKEKLKNELDLKDKNLVLIQKNLEKLQQDNNELRDMNEQLKQMMVEKLKYNGLNQATGPDGSGDDDNAQNFKCISIVTEMARLRLDVNAKDKLLQKLNTTNTNFDGDDNYNDQGTESINGPTMINQEMDILNKFLDETVECIKSWPEDLANSNHVQTLMKTLLKAYR